MKKITVKWAEKLNNYFLDVNGNYKTGVRNGMTAEELLRKCHLPYDNQTPEGRELINKAITALNQYMQKALKNGYCGGAMFSHPSVYFIAVTKSEIRYILESSTAGLMGRMGNYQNRGKKILPKLAFKKAFNIMNNFKPKQIEASIK